MEAHSSGDFMIQLLIGPFGMLCANGPRRITVADFQIRQTIGNRSTSALCQKISDLILVRVVSTKPVKQRIQTRNPNQKRAIAISDSPYSKSVNRL